MTIQKLRNTIQVPNVNSTITFSPNSKTIGSTSIRYRSDTCASDRYLIDIHPTLFDIWEITPYNALGFVVFVVIVDSWGAFTKIPKGCRAVVPYDYLNASEVTLKNMGKSDHHQTTNTQ